MKKLLIVAILAMGWTISYAQGSVSINQMQRASQLRKQQQQKKGHNPYSRSYQVSESHSFGNFYVEYNPHTWHESSNGYTNNISHQGISIGFSYFTPFAGSLGFDAGLKLQYLFRDKTENGIKNKYEQLALTVPVDLVYDWKVNESFAIDPYVGIYGRYNLSAKTKNESEKTRTNYDWFDENVAYDTMKRFQVGWQAGVNFRISDMVTIGGGYWMDFSELVTHTKLYGFNIVLGANF